MTTVDDDIGGSGYSLEDLSEYFDRGRMPRIAAIEGNAECRAVLASMERMGALSREIVETEAREPLPDGWYSGIMREIAREFRAGRDVPLTPPDVTTELVVTEGALYELVRAAGDTVRGVLVGRVRLTAAGDGAAWDVRISISVRFGQPIVTAVAAVRAAVVAAVGRNGDLRVGDVDITVSDVHVGGEAG